MKPCPKCKQDSEVMKLMNGDLYCHHCDVFFDKKESFANKKYKPLPTHSTKKMMKIFKKDWKL